MIQKQQKNEIIVFFGLVFVRSANDINVGQTCSIYSAAGNPYALKYNGTLYYYITNLQGDVLHIVNTSGTPVVSYTYDPYGKPLTTTGTEATTLGAHNPLRYRGYVYDTETGLYYVSSRYYDSVLGRFVNADVLVSTGEGMLGYNMFAYCLNNPVCREDTLGTTSQECFNSEDVDHTDDNKEFEGGKASNSGDTVTLYRAVSTAEAKSTVESQKFSSSDNPYLDSKFFATSQADAKKWGDYMYKDGNYRNISATFCSGVTAGAGVILYPFHDGIGPALLIPLSTLNTCVIMVWCI